MTRQEFYELTHDNTVILDGATGSMLQKAGMDPGACPEEWILSHKDALIDLQKSYIEAGSDIIYAPTFTANRIKLSEYGLEDNIGKINRDLVGLSATAVSMAQVEDKRKVYIAGDITMTGRQLYPMGTLTFEELVDIYKEQLSYMYEAGIDLVVVETMMSLQECRAALLAVKETSELPVMITLSFEADGRTLYGTDPVTAVTVLQSMGADAIGANCSTGADGMTDIISKMSSVARIPVIAKPNCGMPVLKDGVTVYSDTPEEFESGIRRLVNVGASIIGGCCGTDPECIRLLRDNVTSYHRPDNLCMGGARILTGERHYLDIASAEKFYIIGERINPTGKKALQTELRDGSLELVLSMAEEQEEYGADILDVNVGMNGIDETEVLYKSVMALSQSVNLPLSIDTSNVDAMEKALRNYPGRALMNSISLDDSKTDRLLALAKKYGAMFVLLPLSEEGLPRNLEEKKEIIHTLIDRADKYGIDKDCIVVDGLVTTVGANRQAAVETLETIRYCKEELGVETVCGLSNISFGLPERAYINSAFMAMAISEGLTMAIANPMQELLMNAVYASDLLMAKNDSDTRYVERITIFNEEHKRGEVKTQKNYAAVTEVNEDICHEGIYEAILKGRKESALKLVNDAVDNGMKPDIIINKALIPAINRVGEYFEAGRYYLPQLMNSAEAMKASIEYLEPLLDDNEAGKSAGVVVIATVKGDIHDIGKNLVGIMLKNYGFTVHDLGKNVPAEDIIDAAKRYDADIIGLSALMTTTMTEMKNVVSLAKKENVRAKIMIGGAVVTRDYAEEIGADAYSADAKEAVSVAKQLI